MKVVVGNITIGRNHPPSTVDSCTGDDETTSHWCHMKVWKMGTRHLFLTLAVFAGTPTEVLKRLMCNPSFALANDH